jgi:hypothetical protein
LKPRSTGARSASPTQWAIARRAKQSRAAEIPVQRQLSAASGDWGPGQPSVGPAPADESLKYQLAKSRKSHTAKINSALDTLKKAPRQRKGQCQQKGGSGGIFPQCAGMPDLMAQPAEPQKITFAAFKQKCATHQMFAYSTSCIIYILEWKVLTTDRLRPRQQMAGRMLK